MHIKHSCIHFHMQLTANYLISSISKKEYLSPVDIKSVRNFVEALQNHCEADRKPHGGELPC